MNYINTLDGESIRDAIDARERYALLRDARSHYKHSYGGSMEFKSRSGTDYLYRRPYGSNSGRSLGKRSPETEDRLGKYIEGKAKSDERIRNLQRQLEERAPILVARGLGRIPLLPARVLRRLDELGWLGRSLIVLGTNALFAYEAAAGVRIDSGLLATGDVDVLYDARRKLIMTGDVKAQGLIGALRKVDRSFERSNRKPYTASNKDGYMVDLLEPGDHQKIMREGSAKLSSNPEDLEAVSTDSTAKILNLPKFEAITFDEKGLPVRIVTIDPRVFALQKLWIAEKDSTREADRRLRDREQAKLVATIASRHLGLKFDDSNLSALPAELREMAERLEVLVPKKSAEW